MTFVAGKEARVYMGGWDLSGYLNEAAVAAERGLIEATVFTDTGVRYVVGMPSATMTLSGYVDVPDPVADGWDALLQTALLADTTNVWTFIPGGDTVGYLARGFAAREKSWEVSTPADGVAAIKVEGAADGAVENLAVLAAKLSRPSTGASANLNLGSGPVALGGVAYLQAFVVAGTSLDIIVEGSANGTNNWATLATFAQVLTAGAPTAERVPIAVGVSIPQYIRASWTLVGGAATFWLGFQRY